MGHRARGNARVPSGAAVAAQMESVGERIRQLGLKKSPARDAVMESFFRSTGHVSIEELTARAREITPRAAYSTVYRTMKLLVDEGFAAALDFGGDRTLYEPAGGDHHDHLVCSSCGGVQEFEDDEIERLQHRVATRHGFDMRAHRLEIFGTCSACRRKGKP